MKKICKFALALIIGFAISALGLIGGYYMYKPEPIMPEQTVEIPLQPETINENTVVKYIHNFQQDQMSEESEDLAPFYMIGMTRDKLAEEMSDWNIESFSPAMVVLSKSIDASGTQHYILKPEKGYVAVYYTSGVLKEITNTPINSLTVQEQSELEKGIQIDGNLALDKALENFET